MWIYEELTGRMLKQGAGLLATGYSGAGADKNNPAYENVKDCGPIPEGLFNIGPPVDSAIHGSFALPLTPDANDQLFGRSGFLIHGDSIKHPGTASQGCIVLPRFAREMIWRGGDHRLQIVKELPAKA